MVFRTPQTAQAPDELDYLSLPDASVLFDGVPDHLEIPLRAWLASALSTQGLVYDVRNDTPSARHVALRLRLTVTKPPYYLAVANVARNDLLRAVNATLQIAQLGSPLLHDLVETLEHAGSAYMLDTTSLQLVRRVNEVAVKSKNATVRIAGRDGAGHLQEAWVSAYGLDPDPDQAYDEAVRSVEATICPIVSPNADGRRTLGTAISALKNDLGANRPKWELALPDSSGTPASIESLIQMLDLLWRGQLSRHAGSTKSRRQTQLEAEAAVHLAVLLVQWLRSGVLRPRQ